MDLDDPDEVLARTLHGEARGEGRGGMEAVACVVMNRLNSGYWGGSVIDICLMHRQFSCWNHTDRNYWTIEHASRRDLALALYVAGEAISGRLQDVTEGSTYYLTAGSKRAVYLRKAHFVKRMHGLDFYRG